MIIVEGCDNCGKTMLVENLCNQFPVLHYIQQGARPPKSGEDYYKELWDILNRHDIDKVIVDRFFFSELVYGPALRGSLLLSPIQLRSLEMKLVELNPLIILCDRPTEEILETFHEREQLEGVKERINILRRGFHQAFLNRPDYSHVLTYDFRRSSYTELIQKVDIYLRRHVKYER